MLKTKQELSEQEVEQIAALARKIVDGINEMKFPQGKIGVVMEALVSATASTMNNSFNLRDELARRMAVEGFKQSLHAHIEYILQREDETDETLH